MGDLGKTDIFKNYFPSGSNHNVIEPVLTTGINVTPKTETTTTNQRAQGNIDVEGFTDKVKFLLNEVWGESWGDFTMEGPTGKDPENAKLPVISFDVIHRIPSKGKAGLKARPMEIYLDPENPDYTLIINRKWFDCTVELVFFHSTNRDARKLMGKFETFMDTYLGYFKEQGISEMIFQEEVDSRLSAKYKDGIPSTCLHYMMVIERILVEKVRTTKELRAKIQSKQSGSILNETGIDIISR